MVSFRHYICFHVLEASLNFLRAPYLDCLKIQDYFVDNIVAYISNHHLTIKRVLRGTVG
jgi:hypothetical protein